MRIVVQPPPVYKVYVTGMNAYRAVLIPAPAYRSVVTQTILQGPKGEKGDSGVSTYEVIAGEVLSGNRVVYIQSGKAYYYDPSDAALYGRTLGITMTSAVVDATVSIAMVGVMNWTAAPLTDGALYYVGANGQLTTNPTGLTVLQRVGHAIATDKLKINFDINILTI